MIPLPEQKIAKLVAQMRHHNTFPAFLDQIADDEQDPLYPLIQELVSEAKECILIANKDEQIAAYEGLWHHLQLRLNRELLLAGDEQVVELFALYLIVSETQKNFNDIKRYISNTYREQGEVLSVYTEIANYEDEEGLIPLSIPGFKPGTEGGGLYYKDHLLYYHQFLRRNFSSNLNSTFLAALASYYKNHKEQHVAVAIDHFRLIPKEMFRQLFEKARAFGPPLALTSLDDPHAVGLTVYTPSDPELFALFTGIERTEFYWSIKHNDTIKHFEIEEVYALDHLPNVGDDLILTHYVHSMRDIKAHAFIHLDGAVKIYRRNQYSQRHENMMPKAPPALKKIKVFRIDADVKREEAISDNEWSRLIGYFFQNNTLPAEYLNPDFVTVG